MFIVHPHLLVTFHWYYLSQFPISRYIFTQICWNVCCFWHTHIHTHANISAIRIGHFAHKANMPFSLGDLMLSSVVVSVYICLYEYVCMHACIKIWLMFRKYLNDINWNCIKWAFPNIYVRTYVRINLHMCWHMLKIILVIPQRFKNNTLKTFI